MPSQKGRDLLLKIGNGATPEVFTTIGAARIVSMAINNHPVATTTLDSNGVQCLQADAGVQTMDIALEGFFKDVTVEETLRLSAFSRTAKNYQLIFPNGDSFAASFVVHDYHRAGGVDGLEVFSVILIRNGAGTFTAGP